MAQHNWPQVQWAGFEGRVFLTEGEWRTYLRRPPVRFPARDNPISTDSLCEICKTPRAEANPFQLAHRIPFVRGVCVLALTPEFLDNPRNLAVAHRQQCNKTIELGLVESLHLLRRLGVTEVPPFLDNRILRVWADLAATAPPGTRKP